MRRPLALLAALLISASPSIAQQTADIAGAPTAAPTSAPVQTPAEKPAPSLHVSNDEIRDRLRESEEKKGKSDQAEVRQAGSYNFLYIVAAVAIGVIVAAVILD